jgi:hypothetical protein
MTLRIQIHRNGQMADRARAVMQFLVASTEQEVYVGVFRRNVFEHEAFVHGLLGHAEFEQDLRFAETCHFGKGVNLEGGVELEKGGFGFLEAVEHLSSC